MEHNRKLMDIALLAPLLYRLDEILKGVGGMNIE